MSTTLQNKFLEDGQGVKYAPITTPGAVRWPNGDDLYAKLGEKASTSTTVNGHALTGNVTVTKSDVDLGNVTNDAQVKRSEMGVASGVATLGTDGKVPASQLPTSSGGTSYTFAEGTTDGAFTVTPANGTTQTVPVHGAVGFTETTTGITNLDATLISTALRKTAQTLTAAEKTQVKTNLGITISTTEPTNADGENGDIWLVYEA